MLDLKFAGTPELTNGLMSKTAATSFMPLQPAIQMEMENKLSGSFSMNIAILEKANLPDAHVSSGLVRATFEANDPLVVCQG